MLHKKCVKSPRVTKIAKMVSKDNHEQNIWDKLLFSCEIGHFGKSSVSIFHEIFASIDKIFILGARLCSRVKFYKVLRFSWFSIFFTNNCALFQLWGKENLVKHQEVSKYYHHYCRYLAGFKSSSLSVRSSHRRCSVKKDVLENFANLTGKHLCWRL